MSRAMPKTSHLLIQPNETEFGQRVDVRPEDVQPQCPNWRHVGFAVYRLQAGEVLAQSTEDLEHLLVILTGTLTASVAGQDFGSLGSRSDLFGRQPAHALYVPNGSDWHITALTELEVAICRAPGQGGHPPRTITPQSVPLEERGKGANTRYVNAIMMEDKDWADSLLVTEVWTPSGNWSSYPSHKHDSDNYPAETYLEETYYHRLNPKQGFAYQRVYNDDLSLDENIAVKDGDVVLVPEGYHPCGAPYGYDLYYLNVMAGPLRKWRFTNDPNHEWLFMRDGGKKPGE